MSLQPVDKGIIVDFVMITKQGVNVPGIEIRLQVLQESQKLSTFNVSVVFIAEQTEDDYNE